MGSARPAASRLTPPDVNLGWYCTDRWVEEGAGERPALRHRDGILNFRQLSDLTNRIGNALNDLGLRERERFLIRLPNRPEAYATFLAGLKIGAVPVPTPAVLRERELEHILTVADVRLAVTEEDLATPLREVAPSVSSLRNVLCLDQPIDSGPSLSEAIAEAAPVLDPFPTRADDPAFVLFTSGTTGRPKGIAHAHRALGVTSGNPCGAWGMGLGPDDVVFQPHEMAWSYTMGPGFLYPLGQGSSIVASGGKIPTEEVFSWIERHRVTVFATVPTLYRSLLAIPRIEENVDLSSLRFCMSAGEALSASTYREWKDRIGVELLDHLGQGELSMFIANPPHLPPRVGSLGLAIPGYEVAVLDELGNRSVDQVGALAVAEDTPALFYDYLGMPEKWEENHRGGWYLTGDLARMDEDGYYWHVSRADDMIKSRGYLISPTEVEHALLDHPAVVEAAVVGVPDPELGEALAAFVVLAPGHEATADLPEQLRLHVRAQIAAYKTPRIVEVLDSLPKTRTGKIARHELRR